MRTNGPHKGNLEKIMCLSFLGFFASNLRLKVIPVTGCIATMGERIRSLKDVEILKSLVKAHIKKEPSQTSLLWKSEDLDVVVDSHKEFLIAVALTGHRISPQVLCKVLRKQFETDVSELSAFAKQMSDALCHCRNKARNVSSGNKTSPATMDVIKAYGKLPSRASSSPSPPPCPKKT